MKAEKNDMIASTIASWQSYYPDMVQFGIAVCTGMIAGFLVRHFGRIIITGLVISIVGLIVLQQFNLISIHLEQIKVWIGLQKSQPLTVDSLFMLLNVWARTHIVQTAGGLVGFFLGWRLS